MKSSLFRRRDWPTNPRFDLPDGRFATPEQLKEYRRRWRRMNVQQAMALLLIPLLAWLIIRFLHNPILQLVAAIVSASLSAFLGVLAQSTFRCNMCECQ